MGTFYNSMNGWVSRLPVYICTNMNAKIVVAMGRSRSKSQQQNCACGKVRRTDRISIRQPGSMKKTYSYRYSIDTALTFSFSHIITEILQHGSVVSPWIRRMMITILTMMIMTNIPAPES